MTMIATTLSALAEFPSQLEQFYDAFPRELTRWIPDSWEGCPSENLTALEQICHVRDIELEGYHVRFRRLLNETGPVLASLDTYALVKERNYAAAEPSAVFGAFRAARQATVETLRPLSDEQLARAGTFEGYGPVTVRGLLHYLCSHDQQHLAGLQWLMGKAESARPRARFTPT
ncbi:DinB family protein [Archangium lansingense]|uniref:DinB family protein n=1 Tax=Archangium lansingense TaxID=2995310 RepID=UPI003B7DB9B7